ncbi:MAG TPA: glycosyltransferase family 39 protein, partial [Pirellulales bacterium]|nr:glycosyltransferase family 39 protein [Pirellulales bacterium]
MIAQVLIAASVAMIDGGPRRLWRPYEVLADTDYIGAVAEVDSPQSFLREYPRLMPGLPMHCQTHPPGGVLFLWAIALLFGAGPVPAAWATILASSLAVPAVYLLARDVLDEPAARLAAGFFILSPSIVMFSATLLDAVFAVPIVWSVYFLWKARAWRPVLFGTLAGATGSVAAMMTFSASFLGLWATAVFVLTALAERERARNTLVALVAGAATFAAFYAALYAWSGYDPLATLAEAMAGQKRIMAGRGHDSLRQDLHFALANLVAFLFCAGVALAALWMRRVVRLLRGGGRSRDSLFAGSFVIALAIFDSAPLYTLEVEHIWLFLVPFLAIAAAAVAGGDKSGSDEQGVARLALVLLAVQTVLMEVFLETTW